MHVIFHLLCGTLLVAIASSASCDLPTVSVTFGSCNVSTPGRDGTAFSYGVLLAVNQAQICATPSTFVTSPLLEHEDVCLEQNRIGMTAAQCRSRRGNYVTKDDADIVPVEGLAQQSTNMKFLPPIDKSTLAPIQLQLGTSVGVHSGFITSGDQHANSHLPLNEDSVVLAEMKRSGQIASNSFGLDVGSQSVSSPRNGRLTLGGHLPAMVRGPRWEFKIDRSNPVINSRSCALKVDIRHINIGIGGKDVELIAPDSNTRVCIEIYDRLTRLPSTGLKALKDELRNEGAKEAVGEEGKPDGRFGGILDTEPGLLYETAGGRVNLSDLVQSMQITIRGGLVGGKEADLTVDLGNQDVVQPLVGLDENGVPAVNASLEKLMVYHQRGIGDAAVLGRAFLEKLYLHVDYDNNVFYLGHLDVGGQSQAAVPSRSCDGGTKSVNSLVWLIVLTVLLALVVIALLGLAWYLFRKQKTQLEVLRADVQNTREQLLPLLERPSTDHDGDGRGGTMPVMGSGSELPV
ncbi:hypothetical protein QBC39DRAFT_364377 [Podospora conica]|nr:hypothetical protein QBC39DRAFT_364377 [Schizothecium conicum]